VLDILRSADTTRNEILHSSIKGMGNGEAGNAVIPGLVSDAGLLDLRSLVCDITPETIASGVYLVMPIR
jgi:hypothetical protein